MRERSKLPIFADESCLVATDVALAGAVDGINLKLAKCGSLREALRIVHTARALDMQVMAGCMIESSSAFPRWPSSRRCSTPRISTARPSSPAIHFEGRPSPAARSN